MPDESLPLVTPDASTLIARFTAGCVSAFGSALAVLTAAQPRALTANSAKIAALEVIMIVAGYTTAKYWLPKRHGKITGSSRSHVLAGIAAPLAFGALSTQVQGVSTVGIAALTFATGTAVALVHWLLTRRRPRSPEPTLEERERDADLALARALAELEGARDIIPIANPERVRENRPSDSHRRVA